MTQDTETVHKPKHWFTTYYVNGKKKRIDNEETMALAVAKTAAFAYSIGEGYLKEHIKPDSAEWHRFIDQVVSRFSSICYGDRAGKKDDPLIEIGKAKNYDHRTINGVWEDYDENNNKESSRNIRAYPN